MAKNYWLVKQEPEDYAWTTLVEDGRTAWSGVRNFQARNHLRSMKRGDLVLFYHSGEVREVVGLARVVKEAYPDPTADEGDWCAVDLAPVKPLNRAVSLSQIKTNPVLKSMALVRQPRLSVMPLIPKQFEQLLKLAQTQSQFGNSRRKEALSSKSEIRK